MHISAVEPATRGFASSAGWFTVPFHGSLLTAAGLVDADAATGDAFEDVAVGFVGVVLVFVGDAGLPTGAALTGADFGAATLDFGVVGVAFDVACF
jgi:hypothetical protein